MDGLGEFITFNLVADVQIGKQIGRSVNPTMKGEKMEMKKWRHPQPKKMETPTTYFRSEREVMGVLIFSCKWEGFFVSVPEIVRLQVLPVG